MAGLYSVRPIRVKLSDRNYRDPEWWDDAGDFSVPGEGLHVQTGHIQFVSKDRKAVEDFITGVRSTMRLLSEWAAIS